MALKLNNEHAFRYLSLIVFVASFTVFLAFPFYCKKTYISENALLPDYAYTHYGENEYNAWKSRLSEMSSKRSKREINLYVEGELFSYGADLCKVSHSNDSFESITSIVRAHRTDGTEAVVLATLVSEENIQGIAFALSLIKFYQSKKYLSRDIIFLFYSNGAEGVSTWLTAYHGKLPDPQRCYAGALQMALVIDFSGFEWNAEKAALELEIAGINGQLPNLDYFNIMNVIARSQGTKLVFDNDPLPLLGLIPESLHSYEVKVYLQELWNLISMIRKLAFPIGKYIHPLFLQYRVDAITLKATSDKSQRSSWVERHKMAILTESTFRSLNNALEHLHQSFFFYLLPKSNSYISIGLYMPWIGLLASSYVFKGLAIFVVAKKNDQFAELFILSTLLLAVKLTFFGFVSFGILAYFNGFNSINQASLLAISLFLTGITNFVFSPSMNRDCFKVESMIYLITLGLFLISLSVVNFALACVAGISFIPMAIVF